MCSDNFFLWVQVVWGAEDGEMPLQFSQMKELQVKKREPPVLVTSAIAGDSLFLWESGSLEVAVGGKKGINKVTFEIPI